MNQDQNAIQREQSDLGPYCLQLIITIILSNHYKQTREQRSTFVLNCKKGIKSATQIETGLSPPVKYFTDRSQDVLLLWIFYVSFCLVFAMPLCASVYMCLVVTCWERADLLTLHCVV